MFYVSASGVLVHNTYNTTIGLGKSPHIGELGDVSIAKPNGWTRSGLTRWNSDGIEEFHFAFKEAAGNAKRIEFNLNGVNVRRAYLEAGNLTPEVARNKYLLTYLLTEWELRQVMGDRALLNKTTFQLPGRTVLRSNYDQFYDLLLELMN